MNLPYKLISKKSANYLNNHRVGTNTDTMEDASTEARDRSKDPHHGVDKFGVAASQGHSSYSYKKVLINIIVSLIKP